MPAVTFGYAAIKRVPRSTLVTKILPKTDPRYFESSGSMGLVRPGLFGKKLVVVKEVKTHGPLEKAAFITEVAISQIAASCGVGPKIFESILCDGNDHHGLIVMELLREPHLTEQDIPEVLSLILKMGAHGIYHNDAYTRNVMRNSHGRLRFIDFGYSIFFPEKIPISLTYVDLVGMIYGHRYPGSFGLSAGLAQIGPPGSAQRIAANCVKFVQNALKDKWDSRGWKWAYESRVQKADTLALPAMTSLYDHIKALINREWRMPKGRLFKTAKLVFFDNTDKAPWFGFLTVHDESRLSVEARYLAEPTPFKPALVSVPFGPPVPALPPPRLKKTKPASASASASVAPAPAKPKRKLIKLRSV